MFAQRLLRHVPGRSQLMIAIGLAIVALVVVIFVDLAFDKRATSARLQSAASRVELLKDQNSRLDREVLRSQEGQSLPAKAYQYFNLTLPDVGVVSGEMPDAEPAAAQP